MSQLKLTYFDFHGGRGEAARLALHLGNIAFEDYRFAFPEFAELRKSTPLGQVPTLHVDGVQVTQSDAITRYAGKLAGLYPTDPFQALLCDEVMDGLEDINVKLGASFGLTGDALKEARAALVASPLPQYLAWLQRQLEAHGGQYFADQRLTIADLKAFVFVRGLTSGRLDHIPTDLVQTVAPDLVAHVQRIAQTPAIAQYYAKFGL
ncbi:MAG: glutathione S-transferase family protein [Burkholderiales bacterium]|nr:glutathione S-transferase family protein [Burkholderiales bacterium]